MAKDKTKIAVAMSGGVDSSTTALLLKKQGYEVAGITGDMIGDSELLAKAKSNCEFLGIEHHILDLKEKFQKEVIEYFNETYKAGSTPNPCALCNSKVKWGAIFDYAINELGCDLFATGHYANITEHDGIYRLERAKCDNKDQLYFLYSLTQKELSKTIFPLGKYTSKEEIRQIAAENGLPSKSYKDSQGVCFIKKPLSVKKYLFRQFGEQRGKVINISTGKVIGKHTGYYQYTVGQRKGLGIADKYPLYVTQIDAENNIVYLGYEEDAYGKELEITEINWQQETFKNKEFKAQGKIRYNSPARPCLVCPTANGVKITFDEPVFAIAKGQFGVIYDETNSYLIAGGKIV
ncbi:MAG: tRNA 2-thiouridine(34) synthase MnmA [bacterium]|nr:tRNA 2-thiouridine(34) synthase MnmA [bacterium]